MNLYLNLCDHMLLQNVLFGLAHISCLIHTTFISEYLEKIHVVDVRYYNCSCLHFNCATQLFRLFILTHFTLLKLQQSFMFINVLLKLEYLHCF